MSSTVSSCSLPMFVISRESDEQTGKDLIRQLQSTNSGDGLNSSTSITLNVSFAYSSQQECYELSTRIIQTDRILLNDLMESLSQFISLTGYSVSYRLSCDDVYFFCGKYPFSNPIYCELTRYRTLNIKLRQYCIINLRPKLDLLERDEVDPSDSEEKKKTNYFINKSCKRARERIIKEIISKVFLWKNIYFGLKDKRGKRIRITLKEAANHIGISQKSLDEYDYQLKFGRLLGFDFNKHRDDKVSVLRGFVRTRMKGLDKNEIKQLKMGKMLHEIKKTEETSTELLDCDSFFHWRDDDLSIMHYSG